MLMIFLIYLLKIISNFFNSAQDDIDDAVTISR